MTQPKRAHTFEVAGWTPCPGGLVAQFTCSSFGPFEERVTFPVQNSVVENVLMGPGKGLGDLLTVALGVSYYKAGAAKRLVLPPLGPAAHELAKALYTDGLAEFYVRAGLPFPADVIIEGEIQEARALDLPQIDPKTPALVAFGGGKDSYVADAILRVAGADRQFASVVLNSAVERALTATASRPLLFVRRQLDHRLAGATAKGFNGHVPITAINMFALGLLALCSGYGQVIFANERSADEPTMALLDGARANHQFSKSSTFEALARAAVAEAGSENPVIWSALRPFSELWIGKTFTGLQSVHGQFTSCNKNFRLAGDASKRWCGTCAKCAFTTLMTAPFTNEAGLYDMFGANFLNAQVLLPVYREILGLTDNKPWDCVGTIDESRAALHLLSRGPFQDTLMVRTFIDQVPAVDPATVFPPQTPQGYPTTLLDAAERLSPWQ